MRMKGRIVSDTLTPYLTKTESGFSMFNRNLLNTLYTTAHRKIDTYVPVNSSPVPTIDSYCEPGRKAGRLRNSFKKEVRIANMYEAKGSIGYESYAMKKFSGKSCVLVEYSEHQHNTAYNHKSRYAGHKPRQYYLRDGLTHSMGDMKTIVKTRYINYLNKKGYR